MKEIKQAYRRLALQYHPDTGHSASSHLFVAISDAVETLTDPQKRLEHDRALAGFPKQSPSAPPRTSYRPDAWKPSGKAPDSAHFNRDVWNYYHYNDPMPDSVKVDEKKSGRKRPRPRPDARSPEEARAVNSTRKTNMSDQEIKAFYGSVNDEVEQKLRTKKEAEEADGGCIVS